MTLPRDLHRGPTRYFWEGLVLPVLTISLLGAAIACTPLARPAAALSLSPSGAIAEGGSVVLTGARGLAAADLAYITAADGIGRLARAGVIRGATATRVRAWNAEARRLLVSGKGATDAAEQARAAAALFSIADRLTALMGKR